MVQSSGGSLALQVKVSSLAQELVSIRSEATGNSLNLVEGSLIAGPACPVGNYWRALVIMVPRRVSDSGVDDGTDYDYVD